MCCFFTTLLLLGPRAAVLIWWLIRPVYYMTVFGTWIWPLLGLIFLPWVTLMYLIVAPGGIIGFDWVWLGLAFLADIGTYGGGGYGNRERIPGYGS
ncbi:MAG: hypothetical protein P8Z00_17560 [Anaerolineales bacterium]|jgi:hypothetical protein